MHPHEGNGSPEDRRLQIAVAGGSIGGLCAGLALHGSGFDVNVYERHPGPGPHGPAVPLAALLLIGAPRGDRCAAGQDAAPAINPHRCEQNKQCPSGAVTMPCLAPVVSLAIGTTARRQPAVVQAHLQ